MKLNTKRTVLVGFAFLAICSFWQMYDNVIPLILKQTFSMNETITGVIMALDNILALFLLPVFGAFSDRCTSKKGRRTPFILLGTCLAIVLMLILPMLDNSYAAAPAEWKMIGFVLVLGLLLISMGIYRSPAVALMPDVTPKPLRSKANAIINLMGAIGGIIYLIITSILYSSSRIKGLEHVSYLPLFAIVAVIMALSLIVLLVTIDERKIEKEMTAYNQTENTAATASAPSLKLAAEVRRSLTFLLISISCWFFGYNAITTWFTTYCAEVWHMALGDASLCLTVATVGAILSYIPIGSLASKIGRKKTIMGGVVLLSSCFASGYLFTLMFDTMNPILYVVFALVGLAWAAINVNSLPMVVEMCQDSDIGKFTGYYYTFSMAAQTITPVISGTLMNQIGYHALFPYAAIAVAMALVTMSFVKHGDVKITPKKGLEAFEEME